MKKETSYRDFSPRTDRINKLGRKLEKFNALLKDSKYSDSSVMLQDLSMFLATEKEIEIQKSYLQIEDSYWG